MKRLAKKCIKTSFFAIIEAFLNGLTIICYFWYFLQPWILKLQHKTRLFLQYQMFWTVLTSLIYTLKIGVFKCDVNKKLPFLYFFSNSSFIHENLVSKTFFGVNIFKNTTQTYLFLPISYLKEYTAKITWLSTKHVFNQIIGLPVFNGHKILSKTRFCSFSRIFLK